MTIDQKPPTDIPRNSREYFQGRCTFQSNSPKQKGVDLCPYYVGDNRRTAWWTGYYDASTERRLGYIFKKYKLEWP